MSNVLSALTGTGNRAKVHDAQIVTKLPAAAKELVKKAAQAQGVSDAVVVRQAIAEYLERRGYGRNS